MPFDPKKSLSSNTSLKMEGRAFPKIEKGVPLTPSSKRTIDRSEFYRSLEIGDSFIAPNKAFAEHALSWGRKNNVVFTKRIEGNLGYYRVWRLAAPVKS